MSDQSTIEWTDATWNVVTGCTKVSPGCAHCYIARTPPFRTAGRRFVNGATGLVFHEERLELPFRWRKPKRVFVNSLSDLFHEDVPPALVGEMFRVMRDTPQHTYQVLTKRPERMAEVLAMAPLIFALPLPNVWLGVSIENARFTWRADVLREVPAAVRFISAEPLLGSLLVDNPSTKTDGNRTEQAENGRFPLTKRRQRLDLAGIDWLIVGGESGPGARPMRLRWALELVEAALAQCKDCRTLGPHWLPHDWRPGFEDGHTHWAPCSRHTAVFVKQLGREQGKMFGGSKGELLESWPEPLRMREYPRRADSLIESKDQAGSFASA